MTWRVEFSKGAQKDLTHLDTAGRGRILRCLAECIQSGDDPRKLGEALKGPVVGRYWKYRVGDYRVVCDPKDALMLVLVVRVGHRREIYR